MRGQSLVLWGLLVAPAILPIPILGQARGVRGPCNAEAQWAREEVEELIMAPDLADVRIEWGLTGLQLENIRVLDQQEDQPICARLQRQVPKAYDTRGPDPQWDVTFYETNVGFLVVITISRLKPNAKGEVFIAYGQTMVLDRDMNFVGAVTN